ncbi:type II toxin-antitoxin system VapC family toxin [Tautonia sp. JC769]|uniref:type II toxin-antitoxin system VapC family toxin n=1 Tax=Tautonia sp. JC769 TaxID=3232135 RepID=UPI003457B92D
MSLLVLDTDLLSLFQRGHPSVVSRCQSHPPNALAVTIITVEEQLSGWYTLLRKATRPEQLPAVYARLQTNVQFFSAVTILPFSAQAADRYRDLLKDKLGVGRMDLRIASVVLEHSATLVTRNRRDFGRVPGLTIEDWTT